MWHRISLLFAAVVCDVNIDVFTCDVVKWGSETCWHIHVLCYTWCTVKLLVYAR